VGEAQGEAYKFTQSIRRYVVVSFISDTDVPFLAIRFYSGQTLRQPNRGGSPKAARNRAPSFNFIWQFHFFLLG
jgi:hypothetical protein